MVRLDDIYYGYTSAAGRCEYADGDCTMAMPSNEMYACVGRRQCDVNLPTGDRGRYMPKCEEYGTYLQADYTCVDGKAAMIFYDIRPPFNQNS